MYIDDDKFLSFNHSTKRIFTPSKIALVHDWFMSNSLGGAEKVTELIDINLIKNFSKPDIFSLVENLNKDKRNYFNGRKIKTSFIQSLPFGKTHVQNYLPLIPFAIEQMNLLSYDLVISSSHLAAKGIITSPDQLHISYIHTPMRYAWDQMHVYLRHSKLSRNGFGPLIRYLLFKLREWDYLSGKRPDFLIANSNFTARRIKKYWGINSKVIHPPVNIERFNFKQVRSEFYLSVNRLVPNKRIDLLVKAFNKLNLPLIIVGDGPEENKLKKIANSNIKFCGRKSNSEINQLMSTCRAFVYAGIEDFGIAPVEAMASGAPVIAYGKGGILDTVKCISEKSQTNIATGLLFNSQSPKSIYDTISWFEDKKAWKLFNSEDINNHAKKFNNLNFHKEFEEFTFKSLETFQKNMK